MSESRPSPRSAYLAIPLTIATRNMIIVGSHYNPRYRIYRESTETMMLVVEGTLAAACCCHWPCCQRYSLHCLLQLGVITGVVCIMVSLGLLPSWGLSFQGCWPKDVYKTPQEPGRAVGKGRIGQRIMLPGFVRMHCGIVPWPKTCGKWKFDSPTIRTCTQRFHTGCIILAVLLHTMRSECFWAQNVF